MESKRRIATSFFSLIAITLFASLQYNKADAQRTGDITFAAHAGFDGYCVQNQWNPARITVENNGTDINARAQIEYTEYGRKVQYGAELSLPSGSRKEVTVYFYPQSPPSDLAVSLIAEGEQALAQSPLRIECIANDARLYGVLSNDRASFDSLRDTQIGGRAIKVAHIQVADLPTDARGWGALDTLIVYDTDTGALSSDQRSALDSWLADGGKLIVVGGVHWQGTVAGIQDLLPVSFIRAVQVNSLSAISAFVPNSSPLETSATVAVGSLRAESESTIEQDGYSLASTRKIVNGAVIYLAIDPELQPFSKWGGLEAFYIRLFDLPTPQDPWANIVWNRDSHSRVSETLNKWAPNPLAICGIAAFYVAAIGPINYWFLKRRKNRDGGWLITVAIITGFICLFYFFGIVIRGVRPIVSQFTVVETDLGVNVSRMNALVGVYSPIRKTYDIQMDDGMMARPMASYEPSPDWLSVRENDAYVIKGDLIDIGGMRFISAQGEIPAPAIDAEATIELSNGFPVINARIVNNDDITLEDVILVAPGGSVKLGDLAPGKTLDGKLTLDAKGDKLGFKSLFLSSFPPFTMRVIGDDEVSYRRRALLRVLMESKGFFNSGNWGIYIAGWAIDSPLSASLVKADFKSTNTTLRIFKLSPRVIFNSDTVKLPPTLVAWESSNYIPLIATFEVPSGGLRLRFFPAIPIEFSKVKTLRIHLQGPAWSNTIVSLWDFNLSQWILLPEFLERKMDIDNARRFVQPNGEVRMRLEARDPLATRELRVAHITLIVER